MEQFANIV